MRRPSAYVLWAVVSLVMYGSRRRTLRRAALRGLMAAALARAVVAPLRLDPDPGTAVSVAFVAGAGLEERKAAPILALLWAALQRGDPGRASHRAVAVSAAAGAVLASTKVWPVPPRLGPIAPKLRLPQTAEPNPDGSGVTIVVNRASGSDDGDGEVDQLLELLPAAEIVSVDPDNGEGLRKALDTAAARGAVALGVAGGDGSINTAAQVALEADKPLLVVPTGTFNHLAQAVGVDSPLDAANALKRGEAVGVDVATIGGHVFLNTASFGGYVDLVDTRRRLEERIGKWPAMVLALMRVLRHSDPIMVEIDGRSRSVWMAFIGNCRYHPSGFAPTWRERLDDGLLDVRYVSGDQPWARTRLVAAVMTGRLGRSKIYRQTCEERFVVRAAAGPLRLARDGETFEGAEDIVVEKLARRLVVFAPHGERG